MCSKGHEWIARVAHSSNGSGCPYCSSRKVFEDNCLATVAPLFAGEWHPINNGDLTPKGVTKSSNKRLWWMCRKEHEWQAPIVRRTAKGHGCLGCYRELKKCHSLQIINPKLAKEWHPTKNNGLEAKGVTYGSEKKVWWECAEGHEWKARIDKRHRGAGCPVCRREKVRKGRGIKVVGA